MAKVRIYEIANELKIQSKDVIEFLKEKNIMKKTASSAIEDDVIDMVRGKFTGGKSESRKPQPESAGQSFGKSKEEPVKTESIKTETAQTAKTEPEKAVTAKAEPQQAKGNKTEAGKASEDGKEEVERPRKKSSITAVYNPQNSKTAPRRQSRPQGDRHDRNDRNDRNERNNRPQGDRNNRPQGDRHTRKKRE